MLYLFCFVFFALMALQCVLLKVAFNPLPFYVFLSVTLTHTPQIDHYNDRISPFCLCVCGGASCFLSVSFNI